MSWVTRMSPAIAFCSTPGCAQVLFVEPDIAFHHEIVTTVDDLVAPGAHGDQLIA